MEINEIKIFDAFEPSWELLDLVTNIEKFGVYWQWVNEKELRALDVVFNSESVKQTPFEIILDAVVLLASDRRDLILDRYQKLMFGFETNLTMSPLVTCCLFAYTICDLIQPLNSKNESLIKISDSLLLDLGYQWVGWLSPTHEYTFNKKSISEWTISYLSRLRDGQQEILRRFDRNGLAKELTLKERMMLHIIECHPEITTKYIARKLGSSEITVRRMLIRLRKMQIIRSHSGGPKLHHSLIFKKQ
ncbi:DeoR-like helix-turn-helix domain-containing protein [Pedobacter westerhofensis]|uniref:DeoR-like helix-turn-helix domain-containing protein n=1 Tax=Pedobacter westerhofensis TaxID=425512 RepID=A0A521DN05_9SPHI|nr:DeoR family transcriptional regulator [Pedobacter westerhofensis]SMO72975.1 DeoR-like helix-turn-helix domain-containing protein [Pedobacter westerhofensis]